MVMGFAPAGAAAGGGPEGMVGARCGEAGALWAGALWDGMGGQGMGICLPRVTVASRGTQTGWRGVSLTPLTKVPLEESRSSIVNPSP